MDRFSRYANVEEQHNEWKKNNVFRNGMAIITGKIQSNNILGASSCYTFEL
ncbi:MAG TPA: hypothetical protein VE544_12260 [Nitrososphaeraceae archaeon]|nr:hypothetical protein [Nitrososphaeraceae archaeon]